MTVDKDFFLREEEVFFDVSEVRLIDLAYKRADESYYGDSLDH